MAHRKGIGAVVFRRKKEPEFLIFHRIANWTGYEFPKGGRKKGESERACLAREMREELGTTKFSVIAKPDYVIKYKWPKAYKKDGTHFSGVEYRLFVVEFLGKGVKFDRHEHDGFKWLSAKDALKTLTYKDQKDALKYALALIKKVNP